MIAERDDYEDRVAALSGDRQALLARLRKQSAVALPPPMRRPEYLVRAPLSPMQEYLWLFCQQRPPGDPTRNIAIASRLDGVLDVGALRRALDALVADNESLRTVFGSVDGVPYQEATPPAPAQFTFDDLTWLPESDRDAAAWELVNEHDLNGPFDLVTGPLFRARLIRLGEQCHVLSISAHHLICDGTGFALICSRLADLYEAYLDGRAPDRPRTLGAADFAWWQRKYYLPSTEMARHLDYWRKQLDGAQPARLPSDRPRPAVPTYAGTYFRHRCAADLRDLLAVAIQRSDASPLMMLVAAASAVVTQLTGTTDFVFCTDTSGRNRTEWEDVIGLFANVLYLRMDTSGDPTFGQLVQRARNVLLDAWSHEAAPAVEVVQAVRPGTPRHTSPLSHFTLQYLEQHTGAGFLNFAGLKATHLELVLHRSRRDMSLSVMDLDRGLEFWNEYSTDLFDEERIRDFLIRLERVLRAGATSPDTALSQLS